MRWKITKAAWKLAKDQFPSTRRLYVDVPPKFASSGECCVFDLDKPSEKIGTIPYGVVFDGGQAFVVLRSEKQAIRVQSPRLASFELETDCAPQASRPSIVASEIAANYQDQELLGEQVAYLAAWHAEGPPKNGAEIKEAELRSWLKICGFAEEIFKPVKDRLSDLGFSVPSQPRFNVAKRKKKRKFTDYQRVRVMDPRLMDHNEAARILDVHRDKDRNDWYLVIVDGSERPIWLNEKQLEPNEAGAVIDAPGAKDGSA
jgi:hypothetical protein